MYPKTSIILCTYNESNYIENTVSELEKHIPNLELVIVDDFSSDGTIDIIKKINKENKYKVVLRKKSRSLASAFVRGIIETTGDYIGWVDTNMEELAPRFNEMISELESGNDLITLSRFIKGGGDERILIRSLGSKYFNFFSSKFKSFKIVLFLGIPFENFPVKKILCSLSFNILIFISS